MCVCVCVYFYLNISKPTYLSINLSILKYSEQMCIHCNPIYIYMCVCVCVCACVCACS